MKLTSVVVAALAAVSLAADAPEQTASGLSKYLVIFEKGFDTPERIVKSVEDKLKTLGAYITYEYNTVLRGFAVSAPESAIDDLKQSSEAHEAEQEQFPFFVEADKVVSANDN